MGIQQTNNKSQEEFQGIVVIPEDRLSSQKVKLLSDAANKIRSGKKDAFISSRLTTFELTKENVYQSWDETYPQEHIDKLPELYDAWTTMRSELDYSKFFRR